ncbi:hypothetical protein BDW75DRAFT_228082 [Aspergillus navahoensis]
MSSPTTPSVTESPSGDAARSTRFGFPKVGRYSLSYWLRGVQGDPLLNHRTTLDLPSSTDILIIESGMTGTLAAKHCKEAWPGKSVLILEAREFCSGATGRNAGHCKPDQWCGFSEYEMKFGAEQALKQTWLTLVEYVRQNNVDCDLWVGDTLDVPITPDVAAIAKKNFERFQAAGGKVDHVKVTHDPTEASKISHIKDAQACYAWPAPTLYPWKLTAHIMRGNLRRGVNLQTRTKATHWIVKSDRGDNECSQVIHATNALICNRIGPPVAFEGCEGLTNSYGVLLPNRGLFSINPRSKTEGSVLFGGSNPGQPELEKWLEAHPERGVDDKIQGFKPLTEAVQAFAESQIIGGIIARSADGVPWVGEVPGLPGQWLCAGYNGHGMARIFTAAPGLVKLMGGSSWAETQLPEVYQITPARVQRLKQFLENGELQSHL